MVRMRIYKERKRFKRDCADCGERFRPSGRYAELCEKCWKKKRAAKGIRVEKRLHNVWIEREKAKKQGIKIHRLMGKWQYIYRSEKGEVSLIQTLPVGLTFKGKMIWELMQLNPKDTYEQPERFTTKTEAYERIREILG